MTSLIFTAAFLLFPQAGAWSQGDLEFADRLSAGAAGILAVADESQHRFELYVRGREFFCRNARGESGFNRGDPWELRRQKAGVCVDLSRTDSALIGANLEAADLRGIKLSGSELLLVDFSRADMRGAKLEGATLKKAKLSQADLRSADLTRAVLSNANLSYADLSDAAMSAAILRDANLRGTLLNRANLAWSSLDGADLTGARYDEETILPFDEETAARRGMIKDVRK